jgi:hypothetical protein
MVKKSTHRKSTRSKSTEHPRKFTVTAEQLAELLVIANELPRASPAALETDAHKIQEVVQRVKGE